MILTQNTQQTNFTINRKIYCRTEDVTYSPTLDISDVPEIQERVVFGTRLKSGCICRCKLAAPHKITFIIIRFDPNQ